MRRPITWFSSGAVTGALTAVLAVASACAPTLEVQCSADDDCAPGEICSAGQCRAPGTGDVDGAHGGRDGEAPSGGGGAGGQPPAPDARADGGTQADAGSGGAAKDASGPSQDFGGIGGFPPKPDGNLGDIDARLAFDVGSGDPDSSGQGGTPVKDAGPLPADGPSPDVAVPDLAIPDAFLPNCPLAEGAPVPAEICDVVDQDCDGDNSTAGRIRLVRSCYSGAPGTPGTGVCRTGLQRCFDGVYGQCDGEVVDTAEICDGLDNDCDGLVDEDEQGQALVVVCYTEANIDTLAHLPCQSGAQLCFNGVLGPCLDQVVPATEICDSVDNDCDGTVDNPPDEAGLDCGECERGSGQTCYSGPAGTAGAGVCFSGTQTCRDDGAGWLPCEGESLPESEQCNGLDDDCDGASDNDIEGAGEPCTTGVGACAAQGFVRCGGEPAALICDPIVRPPAPSAELCDGIDNSCNGQVDEGFDVGAPCSAGAGVCAAAGSMTCDEAGGVACDAAPGVGGAEDCNGLDDDCDGVIDEGAAGPGLSRSCYSGDVGTEGVGPCHAGTQTCQAAAWGACGHELVPQDEACDGIDNDCNDRVDDGLEECVCRAGETEACYPGPEGTEDEGTCEPGTRTCAADGSWEACTGAVVPAAETCDNLDNDCNGMRDDIAGDGEVCFVGVGACVAEGAQFCDPDINAPACFGQPGPSSDEICDGHDNDCDGSVDDVDGLGRDCQVGTGVCINRGRLICKAGLDHPACNVEPLPAQVEVCDNRDNDCDMSTDENPDSLCVPALNTTARCVLGACSFGCSGRYIDVDNPPNTANGCERGCAAATTGTVVASLPPKQANQNWPGDFWTAMEPGGGFAVSWLDYGGIVIPPADTAVGATRLRVFFGSGAPTEVTPFEAGDAFDGPTVAVGTPGALILARRSERAALPTGRLGGAALRPQQNPTPLAWREPMDAQIPAALFSNVGNHALAVGIWVQPTMNGVGSLMLQSHNVSTGQPLANRTVDNNTDYVSTQGVRTLAGPLGSGYLVVATVFVNAVFKLRFILLDANGARVSSIDTVETLSNATREMSLAVLGGEALVSALPRLNGPPSVWRLRVDANSALSLLHAPDAARNIVTDRTAVAYGAAGPILFYRAANGLSFVARFLSGDLVQQGQDQAIIQNSGQNNTLGQLRVGGNGTRILGAWVEKRSPAAGQDELRVGPIDCR